MHGDELYLFHMVLTIFCYFYVVFPLQNYLRNDDRMQPKYTSCAKILSILKQKNNNQALGLKWEKNKTTFGQKTC